LAKLENKNNNSLFDSSIAAANIPDTFDYIIVGQGLAGSILAYELGRRGARLLLLDAERENSASRVAAGIINPITGRNLVKTWLADEAIPSAIAFYEELAAVLGREVWRAQPINWIIEEAKAWNDFQALSAKENTAKYVAEVSDNLLYSQYLHDAQGAAVFNYSGRVDLPALVAGFRAYFSQNQTYIKEVFDYDSLIVHDKENISYKSYQAKGIIFCQGAVDGSENPFFLYLPFAPAKGEVLQVEIKDNPLNKQLLKHKSLMLAPLGDSKYWLGASYLRDFAHDLPTEEEKATLLSQFSTFWRGDFAVVEHLSAIRPTVKDRKPFLGSHKQHENVHIFNGLGAKGTYLAPYFAPIMADYLLLGTVLPKEVDIRRCK
jgi:glycine/D-amino acid oxidase-like deaminating enzyme